MAKVTVVKEDDVLQATANAIRTKKGVSTTYKPSEMAAAISSISGSIQAGNIMLTNKDTTYDVSTYATASVVDANLIPENIKRGVTILGVTGTKPVETSTATATVAWIKKGKTAWVNGSLITGTAEATISGEVLVFPSSWT